MAHAGNSMLHTCIKIQFKRAVGAAVQRSAVWSNTQHLVFVLFDLKHTEHLKVLTLLHLNWGFSFQLFFLIDNRQIAQPQHPLSHLSILPWQCNLFIYHYKKQSVKHILPAIKVYLTWKPKPSSSSSLVNLIHMKRPVEVTTPGLFGPQKRSIRGEKPKGPSLISIWSKRHSKEGSI